MISKNSAVESAHRQFVLLVPPDLVLPENAGERSVLQAIPVPCGPSFLVTAGSRPPRLVTRRPARARNPLCLEPVVVHRRPYLLMLQSGEAALRRDVPNGVRQSARQSARQGVRQSVRQNGQGAWPLTLLRVKDELRMDGNSIFVSSRRGPSVFPPEEGHVGVVCPLCTVAIVENTLVFACGSCSTLLHCEDERWPQEERLECARLASTCPSCHQPIDFRQGLEWEPEL